jgi:hypothetical protein
MVKIKAGVLGDRTIGQAGRPPPAPTAPGRLAREKPRTNCDPKLRTLLGAHLCSGELIGSHNAFMGHSYDRAGDWVYHCLLLLGSH